MAQEEISRSKGPKNKLMLVRYGRMGVLGWFEHNEPRIPKNKPYVIVKSERGLELGQLVGPFSYRGGNFRSTPEQVEAYFTQGGKEFSLTTGGRFVRFATHEDIREQEHLEASAVSEAKCCQKFANELGLNMKVIEAEHLFGGERIIFYFTSDGRVDFRELVKQLAREYQTRIELRQIGSRDEARLISDYESCGLECCCKRFLKILDPVNMRMAKLQKATLDPAKISGHCGRLKCCLRYEDQTYRELKRNLPARNTIVETNKGIGKVVDVQVLTQLVVVLLENGDRVAWPLDEIRVQRDSASANRGSPAVETDKGEVDILGEEVSGDGESVATKTEENEEEVFAEIEAALDEVSQTQGEHSPKNSGRSRKQTDVSSKGEEEKKPDSSAPRRQDKDDRRSSRRGKNKRKNRRGRGRNRRSQNNSDSGRSGNSSGSNPSSGSPGS